MRTVLDIAAHDLRTRRCTACNPPPKGAMTQLRGGSPERRVL